VAQRFDERRVGQLRVVEDLAPGGFQAVDARLLELIGHENDHHRGSVRSRE
jgi:hypothetical protein